MSSSTTHSSTYAAAQATTRCPGQPHIPSEIDPSKMSYTEVKPMGNGLGKTCYVNYEGGPLLLELPWMTTWDGIALPPAEYRNENSPPKYSIQFSLKGHKGDQPEVRDFFDCMTGIQTQVLNDACTNSMQWLKKSKMTPEVAEAILSPLVKIALDKDTGEVLEQYPPKFKVKVPFWDGKYDCTVFKSGTRAPLTGDLSEQVCGRMDARAIVKCAGLWFVDSKFGMSWKLVQMEYRTVEQAGLASYAFRDPTPEMEDGGNGAGDTVKVDVSGGNDDNDDNDDNDGNDTDAAGVEEDDVLEDDEIVDSDME